MSKFYRFILIFFLLLLIFPTSTVSAQGNFSDSEIFKAQVEKIIQEKKITREDGSTFIQQNIELKGLEGKWKDKKIIFQGINQYEVIKSNIYQVGDKVLVAFEKNIEGQEVYYIVDYIRHSNLYLLALIFVLLVILIGRFKGLRALIALLISFLIIIKIIVPKILAGSNPLLISIIGCLFILIIIIYLTEGFNLKSHISITSITLSLVIVGILSIIFSEFTKLTGLIDEEIMFLIGFGKGSINFNGLLLAGIVIATLGVLDDVVISQVATVEEIKKTDLKLSKNEVFRKGMRVGVSHMSSMINTLFLVYAGASLPLLLLFNINEPPFLSFSQIINQEIIATEIVRTLIGSIGLILSIPIATFLASNFLKIKDK